MSVDTRVLVVDDHPVYRDGLRHLLVASGFRFVAEAANGLEALAYAERHATDVALMDLHMPHMDGITAIGRLRTVAPEINILVLSTYETDADVLPALAAGAVGYLLKDASRTELVDAVRAAARGEPVLSPSIARRVLGSMRQPAPEVLRPREVDLLRLVAEGATNRQAASRLHVSEATVKAYLARIYERLDVRDRASAVAEGYRRGLLS